MRLSKLFLFLAAGALAVCLALSVTTLQVLRNAVSENGRIQENAYSLVGELSGCVRALEAIPTPTLPVDGEEKTDDATEVAAKVETYWLRAAGTKVGLYNAEGKLLEVFPLVLDALPRSLREELSAGIPFSSLEEVLQLLREIES